MKTAAFSTPRRLVRVAGIAGLALFAGCVVYPNGTVGPLFPPPSVVVTTGYQTYYQPYPYSYRYYGYRPYWGYRGYYPYRYWGGGYYRGGYYRGGYYRGGYWR
jgi:hypothetical protein